MLAHLSQWLNNKRFWLVASCIYASVLYSAGLHYAFGPEQTITTSYFTESHLEPPVEDRLILDRDAYERVFDKRGILEGTDLAAQGEFFWKLSDFHGDSGFYIIQAESFFSSIAPYKYRFLTNIIVGILSRLSNISIPITFAVVNVVLTFCTALLFTHYLRKDIRFSSMVSLIGGILFLSMVAVTSTLPFPMIEPASLFCMMLVFLAVHRKQPIFFIIASVAAVATKDILVVSALLWFINDVSLADIRSTKIVKTLLICSAPVIAFAAIRIGMGGSVAEVNYGYDILQGSFPLSYASRLARISRIIDLTTRMFLAFSFLWFGLINLRKNAFLLRSSIIIPVVVMATVLLSSRVERVLGILFPVVIPAFLLFFSEAAAKSNGIATKMHALLYQTAESTD